MDTAEKKRDLERIEADGYITVNELTTARKKDDRVSEDQPEQHRPDRRHGRRPPPRLRGVHHVRPLTPSGAVAGRAWDRG
ncbi:hypothetical protein ACQEU5_23350 [Marinactinospora thermotolerans]|uniref:hypothetical protein n=1 Tax=Marinactinospora thermotolerans TaxID=531310 RepID=UPI001185FDA6|nr:hypothetical protein [Marinactinospora thermotolerans]